MKQIIVKLWQHREGRWKPLPWSELRNRFAIFIVDEGFVLYFSCVGLVQNSPKGCFSYPKRLKSNLLSQGILLFLLFKDGPLTPNIDEVMALWICRRRAQNTKICGKLAKNEPLDPSFYYFLPPPPHPFVLNVFRGRIGSKRSPWKIWTSWVFLKPEK